MVVDRPARSSEAGVPWIYGDHSRIGCTLVNSKMSEKLVRAVVRGTDTVRKTTEWVQSGSPEMQRLLIAILPPPGENFSVVWEMRESTQACLDAPRT
jgi:hypothetical protein